MKAPKRFVCLTRITVSITSCGARIPARIAGCRTVAALTFAEPTDTTSPRISDYAPDTRYEKSRTTQVSPNSAEAERRSPWRAERHRHFAGGGAGHGAANPRGARSGRR